MKGKFDMLIKKELSINFKVTAFANEPLSYHIHKNRKLFTKFETPKREDSLVMAKRVMSSI